MTKTINKALTFIIAGMFILSFVLPTLQGPMGVKLNGFMTFGLHLATINFIEGFVDYVLFLFTALTNLWVVLLLIWAIRKRVKFLPSALLGGLAIASALTWKFNMQESGVLLIGYWIWVVSIVSITSLNLYRAVKKVEY